MNYDEIFALRDLITNDEFHDSSKSYLFSYEAEFSSSPEGVTVIVPVHNGGDEMSDLFLSLRNQSLDLSAFEVIFSLNGCSDNSLSLVERFADDSGVQTLILNDSVGCVARARNRALQHARFRYTTFVDHDDYLSREYLEECLRLGSYRSVVVSNILKVEDDHPIEDYAQTVVSKGFETSNVHGPEDIGLCYRAYTLNAIKTAPTYMLRRVQYSDEFSHSEDIKYWRDVFHAFMPITVKSPSRRDIYFRKIFQHSLSRRDTEFYEKAKPRLALLDLISADKGRFSCGLPQRSFDVQLEKLLNDTLVNLGRH
ncbi:Glycosyltransferase involved in cell wall bisynthesis [Thioclava dalianensis]|uniref:glycosyltransferase family A protein n=1 Tax=Thioclava dalianensis TaxID=1185766 RepID=UPI0008F65FDE|nr:glycosyltransferase family 2 protein [Thioclava dalianensis]SFN16534.1 Glycosyltransferase involved in cell wall bisynthesis [Thioclava dalianensis]